MPLRYILIPDANQKVCKIREGLTKMVYIFCLDAALQGLRFQKSRIFQVLSMTSCVLQDLPGPLNVLCLIVF
jgi:hypothetical protein